MIRLRRKPVDNIGYMAPPVDAWEVARSRVTMKEILGTGEFGDVHKGSVTGKLKEFEGRTTVAIKTIKSGVSLIEIKDFLAEADILKRFSDPHHPNVCFWH